MPTTVYAIQWKSMDGFWYEWQTFDQPLEADRAYERLRALNPIRSIRQIRYSVVAMDEKE